jgi:hypothetical protein
LINRERTFLPLVPLPLLAGLASLRSPDFALLGAGPNIPSLIDSVFSARSGWKGGRKFVHQFDLLLSLGKSGFLSELFREDPPAQRGLLSRLPLPRSSRSASSIIQIHDGWDFIQACG